MAFTSSVSPARFLKCRRSSFTVIFPSSVSFWNRGFQTVEEQLGWSEMDASAMRLIHYGINKTMTKLKKKEALLNFKENGRRGRWDLWMKIDEERGFAEGCRDCRLV
nr:hypothetical protein Iba_chr04dCG11340 [Ipomoea batatas]